LEDSLVKRTRRRLSLIIVLGLLLLLGLFVVSLSVGSYPMTPMEAMQAFWNAIRLWGDTSQMNLDEKVVWIVRFPRFLAAMGVGIGLAVAGVVMQAIIRNPLVDPYITGVSSGAALGAACAVLLGVGIGAAGVYSLPVMAFIGAILAFTITLGLAESAGGKPVAFVLAGVIVGIFLSSITNLLMITSPSQGVQGVLHWLFGSLSNTTLQEDAIILFVVGVLTIIVLVYARELNVVLLGDDQASQLGVNVRFLKRGMLILTSLLTGVCVAFTGVIGFVGLIVPHMTRMVVGGDHRLLLPASIIVGANFLVGCDIIGRLIGGAEEFPVGIITSLIGAPFFAYLLIRRGREYVT
jgi:iron complex transport system permease protein